MTPPNPPDPIKLPLDRADVIARTIYAALHPFCDQIMVAGSIRRRLPIVGDIDIVCLPKDDTAQHHARKRIMRTCPRVMEDGKHQLMVVLDLKGDPVQLDVWFAAHPTQELFGPVAGTWGTILLCRTGPQRHNIKIASAARAKGWHWNPYRGLFDKPDDSGGKWLAGETEDSIYEALGIPPMQPEERDRF